MLVLSAGMPKAGTGYFYNIINELLIVSGNNSAHEIKSKYSLEHILLRGNNMIEDLNGGLKELIEKTDDEKMFVVKTHSAPTDTLIEYLEMGKVKIIYSYRDPRDVILSAIDFGKKLYAEGHRHTFAKMIDFDVCVDKVNMWSSIWQKYSKLQNTLNLKYEDAMIDPYSIFMDVLSYLDLSIENEKFEAIINKYDKNNPELPVDRLHFNKAICGRYKTEMTSEQQAYVKKEFGKKIEKMGYEI